MMGVILFFIVLLCYGLILSRNIVMKMLPEGEEGGFKGFMVKFDQFFENKGTAFIFSFSAFVIGLWNLFAPDFGANYAPSVIGAFLPAVAMILNSAVMYPEIIEVLNLEQEKKDKYYAFVEKVSGFMGVVTLVLSILHIAFFKIIIF